MKTAIVGSRTVKCVELKKYITKADEIISGGARGVDQIAARYAKENGLKLTEILPQYERYGKAAPIIRNKQIVDLADKIIIFWDGRSKGTLSIIKYAERTNKPHQIIICR